ncbi:hypothetical protein [Nocardia sp. NPDC058114]|uniref:hypothetical protein n=1 Tax=Nocardia sp. NPDC058114 TaxID=3346346 RepID=UPI0036D7FCD0
MADCHGLPTQTRNSHSPNRPPRRGSGSRHRRRTDPDGFAESWTYDGENNHLAHTNRNGGTTRYTYGGFDKIATRTDPDGSTTRHLYNSERQLTAVINPLGQCWTYQYDLAGRLTAETDYTGATTAFTPGEHTNLHPRTGLPDPNRIVSEDGTRSIRLGNHEMSSGPTKFHYHEETWTYNPSANAWHLDNRVVRVPFPKGTW